MMHEFLTAVSSLVVENGHWGTQASVDKARGSLVSVLERRLSRCGFVTPHVGSSQARD